MPSKDTPITSSSGEAPDTGSDASGHEGIFIVGAPRSGTTLLQSMLCAHGAIYSAPETSFFSRIIPRLGSAYADPRQMVSGDDIETTTADFAFMTGIKIDLRSAVAEGATIRDAFEGLMGLFNGEGKKIWAEKTTLHAKSMLAIQRFYPRARFLHVIRDPVDSVGSMMSLKPTSITDYRIGYISSYRGPAELWTACASSALLYPDRESVSHIFYEDLLRDPEAILTGVCEFLGLGFEPAMLASFHRSAEKLLSSEYTPWQKANLSAGLDSSAAHRWRSRMTPYNVWLIQYYTRDLCEYFGYYQDPKARSKFLKLFYYIADQVRWLIARSAAERLVRKIAGAFAE
jgi:hypothetical protein